MTQDDKSLMRRLRAMAGGKSETGRREPLATNTVDLRTAQHEELTVFIVAGEHSGDRLGSALMRELGALRKGQVRFLGVGGEAMEAEGLTSLFPLGEIAVMGPAAILKALPRLTRRVYRTVAAGVAAKPDVIVIIDSPEFTHRVGRRLRRALPGVAIIDYVCPSVWAWRPGRARKMAEFIDHVLALLPFEPEALDRLGGPPATYIGHPLSERLAWIHALDLDMWRRQWQLDPGRVPLVVLPGSRRSEVERLMPVFGETVRDLVTAGHALDLLIPTVPHLSVRVAELAEGWPARCIFIENDEAAKFAAFRIGRAALAASGTVTLELGVAGTPMVVGYKVDRLAANVRHFLQVDTVVLANLVLGETVFPEFLQKDCTREALSAALLELFEATPARERQLAALAKLREKMRPGPLSPSAKAAEVVLAHVTRDQLRSA